MNKKLMLTIAILCAIGTAVGVNIYVDSKADTELYYYHKPKNSWDIDPLPKQERYVATISEEEQSKRFENHKDSILNEKDKIWKVDFLKDPEFRTQDLNEEDTKSIERAIIYCVERAALSYMQPVYMKYALMPQPEILRYDYDIPGMDIDDEGNPVEPDDNIVVKGRLGRVEDAVFNPDNMSNASGKYAYIAIVNYLSAKRRKVDFEDLYKKYKWIVHKIVPYNDYQEKSIGMLVKILMVSHRDIVSKKVELTDIKEIMDRYEDSFVDYNTQFENNSTYSKYFEKIVPKNSLVYFQDVYDDNEDEVSINKSALVWAYSFWLRRHNEGNMDNVFRTIEQISYDYDILKEEYVEDDNY